MTLIFVYGTLMKDYWNNFYLKNSKFIGTGKTVDLFSLILSGSIPKVNTEIKQYKISGEIYEVDDITFKEINNLEGVGVDDYMILETEIELQTNKTNKQNKIMKCKMYIDNKFIQFDRICNTGDYRKLQNF